MIHYAVNRTLYSYGPGDTLQAAAGHRRRRTADLSNQKTITVKLKKGIKFAPPVNREITSKDIKYGFERAFSSHVPRLRDRLLRATSSARRPSPAEIKDIPGIETPDDSTSSSGSRRRARR